MPAPVCVLNGDLSCKNVTPHMLLITGVRLIGSIGAYPSSLFPFFGFLYYLWTITIETGHRQATLIVSVQGTRRFDVWRQGTITIPGQFVALFCCSERVNALHWYVFQVGP